MAISIFDSNSSLPFWRVSSSANSASRFSSNSPAAISSRPRWRALRPRQGSPSRQARAALTAASTSAFSPAATSASVSSVAGFSTGKRLPPAAGTHRPLM